MTPMKPATENYPPLPSRIGKRGAGRLPLGEIFHWKILDEVRCLQSNNPSKVLCLERILFEEENRIEVRLGPEQAFPPVAGGIQTRASVNVASAYPG
jgi:hypothetical protein